MWICTNACSAFVSTFLLSFFSRFPLCSVRSQARGVHSQRSHQPSRQPSRQQGQQSPWQRRLRRIRAPGRSVRLLRHFRYPATTGRWGQTLQDPHHLQEDPQPKNPGVCEEINPPTHRETGGTRSGWATIICHFGCTSVTLSIHP